VKYKTSYRVAFDNEQLVDECIRELRVASIPSTRLQWRVADLEIGHEGVSAVERAGANRVTLDDPSPDLPDILSELQDRTHLTRRTIQRVLSGSGRLDDFRRNPQGFIEAAATIFTRCVRVASIGGIEYHPLGKDHFYTQEIFDQEIVGYLRRIVEDRETKSVYDHIVCDSEVEAEFARQLELEVDVKLFIKLPARFTIPTPVGPYCPDWAVLIEQEGREKLCFVVETKGSSSPEDLRGIEREKIECGRAHFQALRVMEPRAEYIVATTFDDLLDQAAAGANRVD
jgi:type III restriction enzyme